MGAVPVGEFNQLGLLPLPPNNVATAGITQVMTLNLEDWRRDALSTAQQK